MRRILFLALFGHLRLRLEEQLRTLGRLFIGFPFAKGHRMLRAEGVAAVAACAARRAARGARAASMSHRRALRLTSGASESNAPAHAAAAGAPTRKIPRPIAWVGPTIVS